MAEPSSKGIGSGTAQVFDTSAPVNVYLASKKEDEKRKEIAAQEARGMLAMFKDKDGWATRDGESYRKYYNSILDKYSSLGWENLTKDAALQAEYMKDIAAFNAFIQASNEQKADWANNDAIFRDPANLDPATGNYTKDQQQAHEDIASKPIDYWLSHPEEYAELREEAYTPKVNLKPPSEYVKTLAPPTNHLKTTDSSTVSDGNQVSYGKSGVDVEAWKAAVKTQYNENKAFRASVNQNYEGGLDEFLEVLPTLYTKTDASYGSSPVGGGRGYDEVLYVEGGQIEDFTFGGRDIPELRGSYGIKAAEELKKIFKGTEAKAYTLPTKFETTISFGDNAIDVSTGGKPKKNVNQSGTITKIIFDKGTGKYYAMMATTKSATKVGEKGTNETQVIVPLDQATNQLQAKYGKEQIESVKKALKLGTLPSGSGVGEDGELIPPD